MATKVPARSILKQRPLRPKASPSLTDEQKAQAAKNQRNLNIALHHANLIQQQKDITAHILDCIVQLLEFPTSNPFSRKDAYSLTKLLEPFQPSDFDNLVEERRVDGKCGYALCAKTPRSQTLGSSAAWKLKAGDANFCSHACARKAVYLKAQLSEVPAWERGRGMRVEIQLHEDDRPPEDADAEVRRARRAEQVERWRQKVAGDEELAQERGERVGGFRPHEVMAESVVEKTASKYRAPLAPDAGEGVLGFGAIEGYAPKPLPKFKIGREVEFAEEGEDTENVWKADEEDGYAEERDDESD